MREKALLIKLDNPHLTIPIHRTVLAIGFARSHFIYLCNNKIGVILRWERNGEEMKKMELSGKMCREGDAYF